MAKFAHTIAGKNKANFKILKQVTPIEGSELGKKSQVEQMFDGISRTYDFLNHFLSLGIDRTWRRKAIDLLKNDHPKNILDVATGTADLAIEALKLNPDKITGVDLSAGMLDIGKQKIKKKGLEEKISLIKGDSENLSFADNSFDAITVGFGVRNFEDLNKGLNEMYRVLKPGAMLVVLEFSKPSVFPLKPLFNFYFSKILPFFGKSLAKHQSAYTYLPESVMAFPEGNEFLKILSDAGYKELKCKQLSFGICSLYWGRK